MIHGFLNGGTRQEGLLSLISKYIAYKREPGELKHLSTRRKRKKKSIFRVAASERGRAQTGMRAFRG